jgi:hypothetical protein
VRTANAIRQCLPHGPSSHSRAPCSNRVTLAEPTAAAGERGDVMVLAVVLRPDPGWERIGGSATVSLTPLATGLGALARPDLPRSC